MHDAPRRRAPARPLRVNTKRATKRMKHEAPQRKRRSAEGARRGTVAPRR